MVPGETKTPSRCRKCFSSWFPWFRDPIPNQVRRNPQLLWKSVGNFCKRYLMEKFWYTDSPSLFTTFDSTNELVTQSFVRFITNESLLDQCEGHQIASALKHWCWEKLEARTVPAMNLPVIKWQWKTLWQLHLKSPVEKSSAHAGWIAEINITGLKNLPFLQVMFGEFLRTSTIKGGPTPTIHTKKDHRCLISDKSPRFPKCQRLQRLFENVTMLQLKKRSCKLIKNSAMVSV